MSLISKSVIKNLNDRILTQNIIMQTLVEVILENGLITEKELEQRIQKSINKAESVIGKLHQESSDNLEEELNGLYFGPVGEA